MANGLLEFANSPAGMGLLSALGAGLAGARRGAPLNAIGAGLLGGVQGYANAQDQQAQQQRADQQNKLLDLTMQQHQTSLEQAKRAQEQQGMRQNYLSGINKVTSPVQGAQPNQFDPMRWLGLGGDIDTAKTLGNPNAFKPAPISIKEGESLIDPVSYKSLFSAPKQTTPSDIGKLFSEMQSLPPGDPRRSAYQSAITKATTHAPGTNVSVNTGQKGFENDLKLREAFKSEPVYKAHQEVQAAHAQIRQSLKQSTPAGDLAAATKIMKILDPGSVVRESELGMAMAATGLLDRVQNYAGNILSGNKLTPKQRVEFQQLADALYGESIKSYNSKRTEYSDFGGGYGLSTERALGPGVTAPPAAQTPAPQTGGVLRFDVNGNPVR